MKKLIYRTLTIQNSIILSSDALDYLSKSVSAGDIPAIVAEMKKRCTSILDLKSAKEVLLRVLDAQNKASPGGLLEVKDVAYKKRDGISRFKFLREHVQGKPQPIYSLRENNETTIFGVYHRNNLGEEVLEDDQGVVRVDFSQCRSEAFLCENVFVGLVGLLVQSVFFVSTILHPEIRLDASGRVRKPESECSFLVFRSFEWSPRMVEHLHSIIDSTADVALVVFVGQPETSSLVSDTLKAHKEVTFVFVPSKCDPSMALLPKKLETVHADYNCRSATNPVEIHLEGRKIGVVVDNIFDAKDRGRYIGTSYLQSFVRTFLSQYSFNPFSGGNMCLSGRADLLVVVESSLSCVLQMHGTTFVSLGKERSRPVYFRYSHGEPSLVEF